MGYSYLLEAPGALATFRQKFDVLSDVEVVYCHESEITLHRGRDTAFFSLNDNSRGWGKIPCRSPFD